MITNYKEKIASSLYLSLYLDYSPRPASDSSHREHRGYTECCRRGLTQKRKGRRGF